MLFNFIHSKARKSSQDPSMVRDKVLSKEVDKHV